MSHQNEAIYKNKKIEYESQELKQIDLYVVFSTKKGPVFKRKFIKNEKITTLRACLRSRWFPGASDGKY